MSTLLCLGFGYCARALAARLERRGWRVSGTTRSPEGVDALGREGFEACVFTGETPGEGIAEALETATHVLVSAPPGEAGDPVLAHHEDDLAAAPHVEWIGYLSTVGVYGDQAGEWVDEAGPLNPDDARSRRRVEAEKAWLAFGAASGKPMHVFRLAGIYGPGRGPLETLSKGKARRIVKPGQVFNRIHVADIATVLEASIARPNPGAVYNVTDDEPAAPQDVVTFGARLLGVEPPPEVPFEEADMSAMARSFYRKNKRVSNARIKQDLGVQLAYPTYRKGMRADAETLMEE